MNAATLDHAVKPIATPALDPGELYAGAIINPDGTGHHIILLPAEAKDLTWQAATEWAAQQGEGASLPDRVEQALLFKHHAAKFKKDTYWSCVPYAGVDACAWCQSFTTGYQSRWFKFTELRARAVRRVII